MSQGNKPKAPRRAEVAERISHTVTTEPVDWNGGTEDGFEQTDQQPDPLNHEDTMGRFMEQCCEPDIAEGHETIHQSTTSGNGENEVPRPDRAYKREDDLGYSQEQRSPLQRQADRLLEANTRGPTRNTSEFHVAEDKFYENYTLGFQARAEYTDGDEAYYSDDHYDSYSSDEEDEGSEQDYDDWRFQYDNRSPTQLATTMTAG